MPNYGHVMSADWCKQRGAVSPTGKGPDNHRDKELKRGRSPTYLTKTAEGEMAPPAPVDTPVRDTCMIMTANRI